ncbi:bifunctional 3-(3-hydroxy-phenyl)propionate/3-hydroxycinnamic acid hydroxylase [Sphingorhabdus pulchriflava]|uniref:Bifunctional 3-(3-hydroxy-phenyl)propionate/3-hydroxycinnamic acid hydroxylase n=1 Tax=Sphingorhabdus pulchriflava TaxID=2292257 RepID=A0A371B1L1_9SPHN|nr:bifunctional 3-(3-hydroxy-phenyl)propionate/3-hydroxycinnamic acid hydroxylase [Sphingorhabdus pulchriflava]RDV01440.1 bifunctional 3-(3-hydroxy-phenyl)propionate/3-hydroxycinnamic acid hydroxylase [Sphingorhabdus pulchriflava]
MTDSDCDVLIAGGGPTGVTLAVLLARRGVKVIVAEKEADIYPLPRAAHIDHECMRILQEAGVADEVMGGSRRASRYDFRNAKGEVLLRFGGAEQIGSGGWPVANMIHQPSVEASLRRSLAAFANAKLHSKWELQSFADDGDGVTAQIETPDGERTIRARYLVGADGARSPVREDSGIIFDDLNFEEPWLVVDVLVDDYSRLPSDNLQICNPERPTTCVLMGEGRHRWEFMIKPGETAEQVSDDAFIETLLEPWNVKGAVRMERKAVYTFRARIASQWRKGRVLLAGDAAHQTPPFAGQGMCSGLRDAANLAWKLAAVVKGEADHRLLDTYQPEREPNVRATIDMAIMMGRTVCITNRWSAFLRDLKFKLGRVLGKLPGGPPDYPPISTGAILKDSVGAGSYFPQPVSVDGNRLDEVLGTNHWLITRQDLSSRKLAPFANKLEIWFDEQAVEAVLVRPDRYVFGTGDSNLLQTSWRHVRRTASTRP